MDVYIEGVICNMNSPKSDYDAKMYAQQGTPRHKKHRRNKACADIADRKLQVSSDVCRRQRERKIFDDKEAAKLEPPSIGTLG